MAKVPGQSAKNKAKPGRKAPRPYSEAELNVLACRLRQALDAVERGLTHLADDPALVDAVTAYADAYARRGVPTGLMAHAAAAIASGSDIEFELKETEKSFKVAGIEKRFNGARVREAFNREKKDRRRRAYAIYVVLSEGGVAAKNRVPRNKKLEQLIDERLSFWPE